MNTTPSSIRITDRDLAVLDALGDYRFLSIPQLAILFFPSKGTAETRLRQLYQHHLAVRVYLPARPYSRTTSTIYGLGAKGAGLLIPLHDGVRPPCLSARDQRSGLFLDHTLRRNDLRIALQRLHSGHPDFELVSWHQAKEDVRARAEIEVGRKTEMVTLIPDGVFGLLRHGILHTCAVEIDLGTVRLEEMRKRYRAYWSFWKYGGALRTYGRCSFRVLTLATTPRRIEALRQAAASIPEARGTGSGLFWFASLDVADPKNPDRLLEPVWSTAWRRNFSGQSLFD